MQRNLIPTTEDWEYYELPSLRGIARKAKQQPEYRFRDLSHCLNESHLMYAFSRLNKKAASGIDKVSYEDYQEHVDENIADLIGRLKRQSYKARLVKRKMDIVGNSTLLDSLKIVKKNGTVCNAGFLGGSDPITFNPLVDMPPSVNFNFFASFMFGTNDFPINIIPMQQIVEYVEQGKYKVKPSKAFTLNEISKAHQLMESNDSCGKIVVEI